jgi:hypothetical protein
MKYRHSKSSIEPQYLMPHLRRGRPKRRWPRCEQTGKQRFGELKDTKHALEAARHLRAKAELLGHQCSWTVRRAYHCGYCDGWHLTSVPGLG